MRLGLYVPFFDRRPAGLGVYIDQMCSRVARLAGDAVLFTATPEAVPAALRGVTEVVSIGSRFEKNRVGKVLYRHAWLNAVLPVESRRRGLDSVFVPFHEGSVAPGAPQVVVVHDLTPLVHPSKYFNAFTTAYMRNALPMVLRRSARVIAVSENTKRDVQRLLGVEGDRISVVTEGYDRATYRPRSPSEVDAITCRLGIDRRYLLYSGTFARHKNAQLLPEIVEGVVRRGVDLQLVLCGRTDAGELELVRAALERRGLLERTILAGYVTSDELAALMTGATAFLYPSLYEGFGLAPLEAMACGAVVLSSNRASLPEVVGEGGILLDPATPVAWIDAVCSVAADRERSSDLSEAATHQAARFGWEDAARRIHNILSEAARSRRATT